MYFIGKDKKLSAAYMYPILTVIFIIPMLLTLYNAIQNKERLTQELNNNAERLMSMAVASATDALWTYNDVSLAQLCDAISGYQIVAGVNILDENNNVIYGVVKKGDEYSTEQLNPVLTQAVWYEGSKIGEIHIIVTAYYLHKRVYAEVWSGFLGTMLISFIILLITYFLTRNITNAIDNIDSGVKAFAEGNRMVRIQVKDNHEIRRLADRINEMFQRIVASDIMLQENYLKLQNLAYYDTLTGLPNRSMLYEECNKILSGQKNSNPSGAIIFMDLDDFKAINDTKGHTLGDQVLICLAKELEEGIAHDAMARIGGDEFIFIIENCDVKRAVRKANKLVNLVNAPKMVGDQEFTLSCSVGIAMFPGDGTDIETLLMKADSAMYQAKTEGKNRYKFYEQSINDEMVKKIELQNEIRQGIINQEFVVYYQPQIDIATGKISGVEALVRWQHPQRGLLMPGDFIELAEETGLIIPLGEYVLRTACSQSMEWEQSGLTNIMMSVNISVKQINSKNIVQDILTILEEVHMMPERLILEITESVAMENISTTVDIMNQLRDKGIVFSLDDFGTGYSSLNYLKNIPIDHLKIDKQFVQSLQRQTVEEVVVRAIIEIAHSMGLTVVAEGIETTEHKEALASYHCDVAQGYYYSKPIPNKAVEELLRNEIK